MPYTKPHFQNHSVYLKPQYHHHSVYLKPHVEDLNMPYTFAPKKAVKSLEKEKHHSKVFKGNYM